MVIMVAGLGLRLYQIGEPSLWFDEAYNLSRTEKIPQWFTQSLDMGRMQPSFFIFLKLILLGGGRSEFALRLPSVIFSLISIFLIYRVAISLFSDREVGLYSAFILAFSCYQINYGRMVAPYALLTCLSLLSIFCFIEFVKKPKTITAFCYAFSSLALTLTHPYGFSIILVQNIYLWTRIRRFRSGFLKMWILSQLPLLLFGAFFLFTYLNVINYMPGSMDPYENLKEGFCPLLETFETFCWGGSKLGDGGLGYETDPGRLKYFPILLPLMVMLLVMGLLKGRGRESNKFVPSGLILILIWLSLPIITSCLIHLLVRKVYLIRYFAGTVPAFYLLVARGITFFRRRFIRVILIGVIGLLSLASLNPLYFPEDRESWREIVGGMKKELQPGDTICLAPLPQVFPYWYYFNYGSCGTLRFLYPEGFKLEGEMKTTFREENILIVGITEGDVNNFIDDRSRFEQGLESDRIWLVISPDWLPGRKGAALMEYFSSLGRVISEKYYTYSGVRVILYKLHSETGSTPSVPPSDILPSPTVDLQFCRQAVDGSWGWQKDLLGARECLATDQAGLIVRIEMEVPRPGNYQLYSYVYHGWRQFWPFIYFSAVDSRKETHSGVIFIEPRYYLDSPGGRWTMHSPSAAPYWNLPAGNLTLTFWADSFTSNWIPRKFKELMEGRIAVDHFLLLPEIVSSGRSFSPWIIEAAAFQGDWEVEDYSEEYYTNIARSSRFGDRSVQWIDLPADGLYLGGLWVLAEGKEPRIDIILRNQEGVKRSSKISLAPGSGWEFYTFGPFDLQKGRYELDIENSSPSIDNEIVIDYCIFYCEPKTFAE